MLQFRENVLAVLVLGVLVVLGVVSFLWLNCGLRGCPDVAEVRGYMPAQASVVLGRGGEELGKLYRVQRVVVELESLPAYVPAAFVAIEDKRFWEHGGVDWQRVPGALLANVRAGEVEEGFSTITMQLARNLFPRRLPAGQRTLWRKLGEMRVAQGIEAEIGKAEILELYLNQIYFGNGAWGIEAAAREYFGKGAAELTMGEAALLAGVPRAPSRLNPRVDLAAAEGRRDVVLRLMEEQGWITAAEAEAARESTIRLARGEVEAQSVAPYLIEEVRRELEDELGEMLYTEGLRIHTAVDIGVQREAERALEDQLVAVEAGEYGEFVGWPRALADTAGGVRTYLQGAVVVMDVQTGDVLALVGGRDFEESQYDRAARARRQSGSAFKPFVYAAALAAGFPPTYRLEDTPIRLALANGQIWEPRNHGEEYSGMVTLRDALVYSKNVATVRLALEVGLDRALGMARQLGLNGRRPMQPAMVLGAGETTLLELTAAYATFAALGVRPTPRLVQRVEDRSGRVVWSRPVRRERVLDPAVAFLLTDILQDVVDRGTGTAVRAAGFSGPAAGKTGTTNAATDLWFIGYTPRYVTGVWVGFDEPRTVVAGATGGEVAAPVAGRILQRLGVQGDWRVPAGVEQRQVDTAGVVVAADCAVAGATRTEFFLVGTVSEEPCFGPYDLPGGPLDDTLLIADSLLAQDSLLLEEDSLSPRNDRWWERMRRRLFPGDVPAQPPPGAVPGAPVPGQRAPESGQTVPAPGQPVPAPGQPVPVRPDSGPVAPADGRAPAQAAPRPAAPRAGEGGGGKQRPRRRPELLGRPAPPAPGERPAPPDTTGGGAGTAG